MIFGFLDAISDKDIFIGLSFVLRFLCGMAEAGAWNACISILMMAFPTKMATMVAWTEMAFGTGACFGKKYEF